MSANLHCEIAIFAVGGLVPRIKASELSPEASPDKNGCAADIIRFPNKAAMAAMVVGISVPIVECGRIIPDNAARLLDFPVGIDEFGTDKTGLFVGFHQLVECREPVGEHDSIVVQQEDMTSPSPLGGVIAVTQEPHIFRCLGDDYAGEKSIGFDCIVF